MVKRYGKRTVVNNVSINVRQGEIVGLVVNGAGKTTSSIWLPVLSPQMRDVFSLTMGYNGISVYKRARAGIGYLAQEPSVFRKMSVEDNIALYWN